MSAALLRWAEVDLRAVASNVETVRERLTKGTSMMAVVKADAYGHGAVRVGRAALAAGADWLAVSTVDEAGTLRRAGIAAPILVMGPVPAGAEADAVAADLRVCCYDAEGIARLAAVTAAGGGVARIHLKVDTGMARLGCPPEEALILARRVEGAPGLELEGLWTHLAEADDPASPRTAQQLRAFLQVVGELGTAGIRPPVLHAANSAAALLHPEAHLGMVRCGLPLYGYASTPASDIKLRPALAWKSRVVAVRMLQPGDRVGYGGTHTASARMRLATVATGYADGYRRALSGRGAVLLGGRRVPVVGRVSMDFLTVDASAVPEVEPGDEVVIIGQQGAETISAEDLAHDLDTIPWEVLTAIGPRVERVYADA